MYVYVFIYMCPLLRYNQKIQEICQQYKKTKWLLKAKANIYCGLPFAHLELFLGDCFEVFFSNLLVYYTRLPSVLPRVLI